MRYSFSSQYRLLTALEGNFFENFAGKGENADNQHFLLFPQSFLIYLRQESLFQQQLICRLQMFLIWTSLHICLFEKNELKNPSISIFQYFDLRRHLSIYS